MCCDASRGNPMAHHQQPTRDVPDPGEADAWEAQDDALRQIEDHMAEHYPELAGKTVDAGVVLAYIDLFHRSDPGGYSDDPDVYTEELRRVIRRLASS